MLICYYVFKKLLCLPKQPGFSLGHALEVEAVERLLHESLDLVVAEVADRAFVGVVDVVRGLERTSLDVESHLLIGIAEGHPVGSQAIHLFDREHRVVHRIVENVLIDLYLINNVGRHLQTVLQFAKGWQEDLLDDLQVAEVAHGEVVHDERYLLRQRLEFVALGADKFKHIGILLVGHDAGARRTLLGEFHEREVLRVEQAGVEGHLGDGASDGGDGEAHVALHLATTHLGIDHVVVHRVEAQQFGGHRAIEWERRAVASRRAERITVGHLIGGLQEKHVIRQTLGIGPKPQSETRRHGYLQVCIARHQHVFILVALLDEFVEEDFHLVGDILEFVTGKEFEVYEHLIVARTARVDLLAHVAEFAGEQHLHLRVDILHIVLNHELATLRQLVDVLQLRHQLRQFVFL